MKFKEKGEKKKKDGEKFTLKSSALLDLGTE